MSDVEVENAALQICKIGDSVGLILPDELLSRLNLKEGDALYPVQQPDGSFLLTTHKAEACAGNGNRPQDDARIPRNVCFACQISGRLAVFGPHGLRAREIGARPANNRPAAVALPSRLG